MAFDWNSIFIMLPSPRSRVEVGGKGQCFRPQGLPFYLMAKYDRRKKIHSYILCTFIPELVCVRLIISLV